MMRIIAIDDAGVLESRDLHAARLACRSGKTRDLLVRETDADPHVAVRQRFPVFFGEMPEYGDDAPAHGGMGGAGNPCLARRASPRNLARDHHRELRPVAHEPVEIFDRRRADVRWIERLGDRQATRLVEECKFAEDVTGANTIWAACTGTCIKIR